MSSIVESLLGEVLKEDTLKNIANAVGIKEENVSDIISAAIPTLMNAMNKNAETEEGAESLAQALEEHASTTKLDVAEEVKNADVEDGEGIIGHILGDNLSSTLKTLSSKIDLDPDKIKKVLAMIAPIMLTFIASAKKKSKKSSSSKDLTQMLSGLVEDAVKSKTKSEKGAEIAGELVSGLLKAIIK